MASMSADLAPLTADVSRSVRKKLGYACERCREKRIKCSGVQPCDQCSKKALQCLFTSAPSTTNDMVAEKLDLVLSRIDRLERSLQDQAVSRHIHPTPSSLQPRRTSMTDHDCVQFDQLKAARHRGSYPINGLAQLNPQTGCFEYYGGTSTFVMASSLGKRVRQLEETLEFSQPSRYPLGERRLQAYRSSRQDQASLVLDDLTSFCDYVVPLNAARRHRRLCESVTDRHLDIFFDTIHIFLPIFDQGSFRARYNAVRSLFGDHRLFIASSEQPSRQQFLCLLYSVLALGALYEDESDDSASWASWYFAEAQDSLGPLLDAANLELVQAAMLMGAYAQHAMKPNLAYVLNGIAARLAFSIGLYTERMYSSGQFQAEEARRTWWLIYIQEVELSLDSGRPMSLRTSDMEMDYPLIPQTLADLEGCQPSQIEFIQCLAEIAKIMTRILKLVNHDTSPDDNATVCETETLRTDLQEWYASLPAHLLFHETASDDYSRKFSPRGWQARQQSSLRIHYNLAILILHRGSLGTSKIDTGHQIYTSPTRASQEACLNAARDMLKHIHHIFRLAPSLRRWSYYCFYCLQSTLVLLTKLVAEQTAPPHRLEPLCSEGDNDIGPSDWDYCEMSIHIFEQIELKASQRCAEVVRRFLEKLTHRVRRKGSKVAESHRRMGRPSGTKHHVQSRSNGRDKASGMRSTVDASTTALLARDRTLVQHFPEAQLLAARQTESLSACTMDYPFPDYSWKAAESVALERPEQRDAFLMVPSEGDLGGTEALSNSADGVCTTSPPISLGGLQTELYGAFHGIDGTNYSFHDLLFEDGAA